MAMLCRGLHIFSPIQALTETTPLPWLISFRSKFTRARIPQELLDERAQEHEKDGGNPEQPSKLHVVTRVKSTMCRPYWEKKSVPRHNPVSELYRQFLRPHGLVFALTCTVNCGALYRQAYIPVIHKNIPSVNNQLKCIKHLVRIQPLKLPHGLPDEEAVADTYLNNKGERIVRHLLKPVEPKAFKS